MSKPYNICSKVNNNCQCSKLINSKFLTSLLVPTSADCYKHKLLLACFLYKCHD